jgi:hypothetical protein
MWTIHLLVLLPLFTTAALTNSGLKSITEVLDSLGLNNHSIHEHYSIPIDENFYIRYDLTQVVQNNILQDVWGTKTEPEKIYLNSILAASGQQQVTNQSGFVDKIYWLSTLQYNSVVNAADWASNQNATAMWLPYIDGSTNYVLVKTNVFELQYVSNRTCAVDNTCNGHSILTFDIYGNSLFHTNGYGLATPVNRFNDNYNGTNAVLQPNTNPGQIHVQITDEAGNGLTKICPSCLSGVVCFRPDVPVHVLQQTSVAKVAVGSLQPGDIVIGDGRTSTVLNVKHFSTTDMACRVPPDFCGALSAGIVVSKSHALRCADWPTDEWTFCQDTWERIPVTEYVHVELESYLDDHLLSGSIVLESWDGYTREADSIEDACSTRGCPWPHRYEAVGLNRWRRVDLRQTLLLQHQLRLVSM